MIEVRRGLAACVVALGGLLAMLDLGAGAVAVGLACGAVLAVAAARGAAVDEVTDLGPADLVTLTRAVLACGVAALVAESFSGAEVVTTLVPLTVVALALDFVDGRVARRTGTASGYGGRLDGEADAFLILVLSVYVARGRVHGCWRWAWSATRTQSRPGCCRGCSASCRRATGARSWPPSPASPWPWLRPASLRRS